jgi:hypothetical protein
VDSLAQASVMLEKARRTWRELGLDCDQIERLEGLCWDLAETEGLTVRAALEQMVEVSRQARSAAILEQAGDIVNEGRRDG